MEIKLINLKRTCHACPSQWEGQTNDNRWVYFRFRHGELRIELGQVGVDIDDDNFFNSADVIFSISVGGPFDGYMTFEELKGLTNNVIDYSLIEEVMFELPYQKEFFSAIKEDVCGNWIMRLLKKILRPLPTRARYMLVAILLLLIVKLFSLLLSLFI